MMNSEARKRAAGIAASVPTAPEPTPTLEDAPGADSEALAARDADRDATLGNVIAVHTSGHLAPEFCTADCLARAVLGSSWLADHDRQAAERALDSVIAKWNWNPETHHVGEVHKAIVRDLMDARAGLDGSNR